MFSCVVDYMLKSYINRQVLWSKVTQWLEHGLVNREIPSSNIVLMFPALCGKLRGAMDDLLAAHFECLCHSDTDMTCHCCVCVGRLVAGM